MDNTIEGFEFMLDDFKCRERYEKHSGDCTDDCHTCQKCLWLIYIKDIKQAISTLKALQSADMVLPEYPKRLLKGTERNVGFKIALELSTPIVAKLQAEIEQWKECAERNGSDTIELAKKLDQKEARVRELEEQINKMKGGTGWIKSCNLQVENTKLQAEVEELQDKLKQEYKFDSMYYKRDSIVMSLCKQRRELKQENQALEEKIESLQNVIGDLKKSNGAGEVITGDK